MNWGLPHPLKIWLVGLGGLKNFGEDLESHHRVIARGHNKALQ